MPIVPQNWKLPEAIARRISPTTYGRQRAIVEERQIVLVLHRPPGPDDEGREGVLFWRDAGGEWSSNKGQSGAGGPKRHLQEYAALEERLSDAYEAATTSGELFAVLDAAVPAARAARNGAAALQAARQEFGDDPTLLELRDRSGDIERNFDLLVEDVRNKIQYRAVREAEEQAALTRESLRASHRLNLLAALFLPVSAVGAIFGMNLTSGLIDSGPALFWLATLAALGLGFGMALWVVGRAPRSR